MLRKTEVIKELLNHSAEIKCVNGYGFTPYEYYVYHIKLIDVANPYVNNIPKSCLSNMGEFTDLYFHVDSADNLELQNRIKRRNKVGLDNTIASSIYHNGTAEKSLEERHEEIVADQFAINKENERKYKEVENIVNETSEDIENKFYQNAPLVLAVRNMGLGE